ncbi:Oxysterol-binding protein [Melia azedarach]|uniref:Oxysterol-binding protein n=1 Tax=Melia azedarach TaxID=155640 RepID=A0ACC1XD75_MELAZ|nr:Oxysterol-binding protein [Melia azedarach]
MDLQVMEGKRVVLTKPLSFDGDSSSADFRPPNILQRVLSLFKNVRPGTDLTKFQLPAIFNIPKSHLQCFGESVYCIGDNILSKCNSLESPVERFTSVVAWSISITRPLIFGSAPYNSILGETHHVSRGSLNVLLEQVSHHPPVSALHATDEKENVEIIWCQHPVPKFYGASVEAEVHGKKQLKLLNHKETYEMNSPKLCLRFLPVPGADWVGDVRIKCKETGLEAELTYRANSLIGFGRNHRAVRGKIYDSSSSKILYEIDGHWDRTVTAKDINNGRSTVIYNAKEVLSGLKAPIVKDMQEVWASESAAVWSEVSQHILNKEWGKATEAKKAVEEKQRKQLRERESAGETWVPKHFSISYSKENGWDCSPLLKFVPPAPIVVPL